jgi:hypothetical protein
MDIMKGRMMARVVEKTCLHVSPLCHRTCVNEVRAMPNRLNRDRKLGGGRVRRKGGCVSYKRDYTLTLVGVV